MFGPDWCCGVSRLAPAHLFRQINRRKRNVRLRDDPAILHHSDAALPGFPAIIASFVAFGDIFRWIYWTLFSVMNVIMVSGGAAPICSAPLPAVSRVPLSDDVNFLGFMLMTAPTNATQL